MGLNWWIASQPQFKWWGAWAGSGSPYAKLRAHFERMAPGAVPQLASMRHEGRQCHSRYLGGGRRGDDLTRAWWHELARAIGDRRVVIAFEPDSLGTVDCLARHRRRARLNLLRDGVDILSRLPNATIYLEGGASDWEPAERTARQLRYIGIHKVRGFMLNATHFDWTASNIRHGLKISRLTGGKPFIINTSHNGNGPTYRWPNGRKARRVTVWCNPPKAALGSPPTSRTAHPKVDAYLWIERPGFSNGSCNGGPLPVGSWWPERALKLAKRARW